MEIRGRVAFMGSPEFAVPSLEALVRAGFDIAVVVTQPDRPAGRGGHLRAPAVKLAAEAHGLRVVQPQSVKDEAFLAEVDRLEADAGVVAAYGKILPEALLKIPRRGFVNVHSSLLPRWRGASPVAAAILAGDAETGVSIMELVKKMDAGPVIAQRATPILRSDTTGSLEPRLAAMGAELLVDSLPGWLEGRSPVQPQDESLVTYCRLLKKEDGHLAGSMTAAEAERAVRAYDPWPGAFVVYRGERLGVWKARVEDAPLQPGAAGVVDGGPAIGFREGALVLEMVQKPGSRRMDGRAFLNGERGTFGGEVGLA